MSNFLRELKSGGGGNSVFPKKVRAVLLAVFLLTINLQAAPFGDNFIIDYSQPNGDKLSVRLLGDEFYAVAETVVGYTVVRDEESGVWCYASLNEDQTKFISTGLKAINSHTEADVIELISGLEKHLKLDSEEILKRISETQVALGRDSKGRLAGSAITKYDDPQSSVATRAVPTSTTLGDKVGLCILIDFSDQVGTITQAQVDAHLNQPEGYTGFGNACSVNEYFSIQSNGKLNFTNTVTKYVRVSKPKSYYDDGSTNSTTSAKLRQLVREALDILAADDFDFTGLSLDDDGNILSLNIYYAGSVASQYNTGLWPVFTNIDLQPKTVDAANGIKALGFQISDMGNSLEIGTFCHENGHMLCGFPDLYAYNGNPILTGKYSIMGKRGDVHPPSVCPYLKIHAGWATVIDIDSSSHQKCGVEVGNNFYYRYKNPAEPKEYFLIDTRCNTIGYEGPYGGASTGIGGIAYDSGLMIYHCNELGSNTNASMSVNPETGTYYTTYEFMIVEANYINSADWWLDPFQASPSYTNTAFEAEDVSSIGTSNLYGLKFWANQRTTESGLDIHSISSGNSKPSMTFTVGAGAVPGAQTIGLTSSTLSPKASYGEDANSQTFAVFNGGGGTLSYSISDNQSWLSCSTSSGTATSESDLITVNYNTSGMASGSYNATITISDSGATNNSQTIAVNLTVAEVPAIGTNVNSISKTLWVEESGEASFQITNTGGGTLDYTLSENSSWLSLSRTSGSASTESDVIYLNFDATSLASGVYNSSITISGTGVSPKVIPVTLTVESTYTITFDANNATSGTAPSQQSKEHNIGLTLSTNSGNLTRKAYDFVGWNTAANGTGTSYAAGATYSTNAHTTLYAEWAAQTIPPISSITKSGITTSEFTLNWNYSGDVDFYEVTISPDSDYYPTTFLEPVYAPTTTFTATGLEAATRYYYRIRVNLNGVYSDYTGLTSVVTVDPGFIAGTTDGVNYYIVNEWTASSGSYQIQSVSTSGADSDISDTAISSSWFLDQTSHKVVTTEGSTFTLIAKAGTGASAGGKAWIDWNHDGTFSEDEKVGYFAGDNANTGSNYSIVGLLNPDNNTHINITIPTSGLPQLPYTTRIRVRSYDVYHRTSVVDIMADDNSKDGQARDYELTINEATGPINVAPVASDDNAETNEGVLVNINVLANDSDANDDTLSIESITQGSNGTVTINGTTIDYSPAVDFSGADSFTYTVSDGNGGTDTATVNVTVNEAFTTVPNVVGQAQATAESNLTAANLTVGVITTAYSFTVPAGNVISQSVPAGNSVEINATVNLEVSLGDATDYTMVDGSVSGTVGRYANPANLTFNTLYDPVSGISKTATISVKNSEKFYYIHLTVEAKAYNTNSNPTLSGRYVDSGRYFIGVKSDEHSDGHIQQNEGLRVSIKITEENDPEAVATEDVLEFRVNSLIFGDVGGVDNINVITSENPIPVEFNDAISEESISTGAIDWFEISDNGTTDNNGLDFGSIRFTVAEATIVPNVVGQAQATAESNLIAANLTVGTITQEFSETVTVGEVISQSEAADSSVAIATTVDLVVSKGSQSLSGKAIQIADNQGIQNKDLPFTEGTVSFWFNPNKNGSYPHLFQLGDVKWHVNNTTSFGGSGGLVKSGGGVSISPTDLGGALWDKWHHFAVTVSGTDMIFYVDGKEFDVSQSYSGTKGLAIGCWIDNFGSAQGQYDEVSVWSKVMNLTELRALRFQELNGNESELLAYYKLDGNLYDSTGNGNDLTKSGDPIYVDSESMQITVPNVVGQAQAAAESNLIAASLTVGTITEQFSDTVLAGCVISQSIDADTVVGLSTSVDLVISNGIDAGITDGVQYVITQNWNSYSNRWDFDAQTTGANIDFSQDTNTRPTAQWYSNQTANRIATTEPGQTFTLALQSFRYNANEGDNYFGGKVWVDWNNDGEFDDATETAGYFAHNPDSSNNIFDPPIVSATNSLEIAIAVPAKEELPKGEFTTRIRVRVVDVGGVTPTDVKPDNYTREGQMQDYSLVIKKRNYNTSDTFEGDLAGWYNNTPENRTLPVENFISTTDSWSGRVGSYGGGEYKLREENLDHTDDTDNNLKVLSSPEFKLSRSSVITAQALGGTGSTNEADFPSFYSDLKDKDIDADETAGFMGIALRRVSDGKYIAYSRKESNGHLTSGITGFQELGWDSATIAAATASDDLTSETYAVDLIDAFSGSWGWIALDAFELTHISKPIEPVASNAERDGFTVSWDPVDGATGYKIVVSKNEDLSNPVFTSYVSAGTRAALSQVVTGLEDETDYYVGVSTEQDGYYSAPQTISGTVMTPAIGINVIQTDTELTWTVAEEIGVKSYRVINLTTGEIVNIQANGSAVYTVSINEGDEVKLVVIDQSGYTQTFIPADGSLVKVVYDLIEGWNLIAMPGENADTSKINSEFWIWNGNSYETVDKPEVGQAAWVYAASSTQVVITANHYSTSLTLSSGWNLVGPTENISIPEDAHTVYGWNETYQEIANDGVLLQGVGYWIFSL